MGQEWYVSAVQLFCKHEDCRPKQWVAAAHVYVRGRKVCEHVQRLRAVGLMSGSVSGFATESQVRTRDEQW